MGIDDKQFKQMLEKIVAERGAVPNDIPPAVLAEMQRRGYNDDRFAPRMELLGEGQAYTLTSGPPDDKNPPGSAALREAKKAIEELIGTLERIKKEPLILHTIDRISKDGKHTYVKKGETELRVEAPKDLKRGDEVLLHPKTLQIVESLGRPPLEAGRFCPERVPDVTWDDIGGQEVAKADMIEAIEMPHNNKKLFDFYGKKQIKGILLSGPPGCGKTMLGKAAANSLSRIYGKADARTGFLYVKGPEILNQFVGATEQIIRDMFFDAQRHKDEHGYPAIIFLDEADAILAARGSRNIGIGNTIVPMFLTEMDGLEESGAIVIIATNRPDVLDPAIVRDGRCDRKVTVARPTQDCAAEILRLAFTKTPVQANITEMAIETAEMMYSADYPICAGVFLRDIISGAMLANCVNLAVSQAIRRDILSDIKKGSGVTMDDVRGAIARIQQQSTGIMHDLA